jgi:hypothetical protein
MIVVRNHHSKLLGPRSIRYKLLAINDLPQLIRFRGICIMLARSTIDLGILLYILLIVMLLDLFDSLSNLQILMMFTLICGILEIT